jgi:hypothetical protein
LDWYNKLCEAILRLKDQIWTDIILKRGVNKVKKWQFWTFAQSLALYFGGIDIQLVVFLRFFKIGKPH